MRAKGISLRETTAAILISLLISSSVIADGLQGRQESSVGQPPRTVPLVLAEVRRDRAEENHESLIAHLFDGINIRTRLGDDFEVLYSRHRREIARVINDNPNLVWETIDLVLDALPALRKVEENDGKLYLDKRTYARAESLFGKCESLASPGLAMDLRKAKRLVDRKTTELDSGQVVVDLRE